MAKTDTFKCSVITPEQAVLECDATFVAFPAHDGEMGVLLNRAPLVCKLGIGSLRVESSADQHTFFIDGGFAEVVDNRLTILTEQAKVPDQIDRSAAEQALADARAMKITDEASYTARANAFKRAKTQLKLAQS
ncbi:MAG: ATP synthase F1 subunit epsilon [Planctomycetota bacterium]|jgi:F-type H+-transporting ATPase subunit epsilon